MKGRAFGYLLAIFVGVLIAFLSLRLIQHRNALFRSKNIELDALLQLGEAFAKDFVLIALVQTANLMINGFLNYQQILVSDCSPERPDPSDGERAPRESEHTAEGEFGGPAPAQGTELRRRSCLGESQRCPFQTKINDLLRQIASLSKGSKKLSGSSSSNNLEGASNSPSVPL